MAQARLTPPSRLDGNDYACSVPIVRHFLSRHLVLRAVTYATPVVLAGAMTVGCSGFNKAFGQREAIVIFQQGTPASVRMSVRAACSHIPQATPEPLPADKKLSDTLNDVRYRIDNASDAQLTQLENCLDKFRSVKGVETPQDENA